MKSKTTKRHDRRRKLATALISGAMGAVAAQPAFAQDVQQISDERVAFDIAAQPLSSALSDYARQAGVNALYYSERLHGLSAPAVEGDLTRQDALDRLLLGSGYGGRINGANLILVQDASRPQRDSAATNGAETANEEGATASDDQEEIVVTGTRIRGAAPAGSHVITLDREDIDQTGRSTVQEVLQTLPQNFGGSQNEATQEGTQNARSNFTYGSTVDLRGLGADATLTLVDGHRLAPAGVGGYIDISTIPLSAVERVEVLADGASAAYGADAVAGVVNLILRDDFEGAETGLRFGVTSQGGASERSFSQLLGTSWRTGHIMGAYEFRERDELNMLDRPFLASANFTDRGGTDFRGTRSNPGNIIRIGTTTVSLPIP
ncbi:MAG: TonB-dependent receptor, partial [Terricaulis sp.]